MQWTQRNKYIVTAVGACVLGVLTYGGIQWSAARELARINDARIEGGQYASPLSYQGSWYTIPPNEIHASGIEEGGIPALTDPKTMSITEADAIIADDLGGIAVEIDGDARFYPVQIMNWHEVVHDTLGNESILVYYGPLTGAASVYHLPDDMRFITSGQEYNNDVLLKEEGTQTLWSGIFGSPVVAQSEADLDTTLSRISSTFMTWGEWKDTHETGTVLSTDTGHTRDYTRHPYGNYENSPGVYFPINHSVIPVRAKEPAYVVQLAEGSALMVSTVTLLDQTPSVQVGNACVVAFRDLAVSYANIFFCNQDDQTFTFTRAGSDTFVDAETSSTWNTDGVAISGELRGTHLVAAPAVRLYTFAADALFPTAMIMGEEFIFEEDQDTFNASDVLDAGGALIEGENIDGATIEVIQ